MEIYQPLLAANSSGPAPSSCLEDWKPATAAPWPWGRARAAGWPCGEGARAEPGPNHLRDLRPAHCSTGQGIPDVVHGGERSGNHLCSSMGRTEQSPGSPGCGGPGGPGPPRPGELVWVIAACVGACCPEEGGQRPCLAQPSVRLLHAGVCSGAPGPAVPCAGGGPAATRSSLPGPRSGLPLAPALATAQLPADGLDPGRRGRFPVLHPASTRGCGKTGPTTGASATGRRDGAGAWPA